MHTLFCNTFRIYIDIGGDRRAPIECATSKDYSVVAKIKGVTEGMNEKGLAMGGLFCKTSSYKTADGTDSTPVVSLAVLVSYFLDNFATVDEVENWLRNNDFGISGKTFRRAPIECATSKDYSVVAKINHS